MKADADRDESVVFQELCRDEGDVLDRASYVQTKLLKYSGARVCEVHPIRHS